MCTVVILFRPGHAWPLLLAANRDEMRDRPWDAPARHWPDRANVVAGRDRLADGTWLGLNDEGVVAGVLNRRHSLGPEAGFRSRGELPLEALDHAEAGVAADALSYLETASYRPFNLVVADNRDAFWLRSAGEGRAVEAEPLAPGLSMFTAYDLNDPASPRMRMYLPRFAEAEPPDPGAGIWDSWTGILASRLYDAEAGPGGAMNVHTDTGFGTVSSSLLALPAAGRAGVRPIWLFAAGSPGEVPFDPVV
jgi:hypothetical protein